MKPDRPWFTWLAQRAMELSAWLGSLPLNEHEREMDARLHVDDKIFYDSYYAGTGIPNDIPIRLRRLVAHQLGRPWEKVVPSDNLPSIDPELDMYELLVEIDEEFKVSIAETEVAGQLDTFDSIVQCLFAQRHKL